MHRRLPALVFVLLGLCLVACSCRGQEAVPEIANHPRAGGLDVTFLLAADLHFGTDGSMATTQTDDRPMSLAQINEHMVDHMNTIAGREYPSVIGGLVDRPKGLLLAGDLTESGTGEQWRQFLKVYGRTGTDGRLGMPVHESVGNHDLYNLLDPVSKAVRQRHGDVHYSWDVGDLHLVCLGEPNDNSLAFLRRDLPAVGRERPVLIYFHYAIVGPYSEGYWFGQGQHREQFAAALKGFNVIGLFHGHFHGSGHYRWKDWDVYDVGSPKHGSKDFFVIRVTDDRLTVCSWNYEARPAWWWLHSKRINEAAKVDGRGEIVRTWPHGRIGSSRPLIPHPTEDLTTGR